MPRMVNPPLVRRAQADLDFIDALDPPDNCLAESLSAAEGFIAALEKAYDHIQRAPAAGSPRLAHELNIPGLRSWSCSPYPQLAFYVVQPERIEVWRVLHGSRDIPAWLQADTL